MINTVVTLQMPFKSLLGYREKPVPFLFRIMTLEMTCNDLGVELGEMFSEKNMPTDIYQSLLWNGYLAACMVQYRKPKYPKLRAAFWAEHMSSATRAQLSDEVSRLMTFLRDGVKDMPEGDGGEAQKKK